MSKVYNNTGGASAFILQWTGGAVYSNPKEGNIGNGGTGLWGAPIIVRHKDPTNGQSTTYTLPEPPDEFRTSKGIYERYRKALMSEKDNLIAVLVSNESRITVAVRNTGAGGTDSVISTNCYWIYPKEDAEKAHKSLTGTVSTGTTDSTGDTNNIDCGNVSVTCPDEIIIPTITSIIPFAIAVGGGTAVSIAGANFPPNVNVLVGGVAASISSNTAALIMIVTPPLGGAGATSLTITDSTASGLYAEVFHPNAFSAS